MKKSGENGVETVGRGGRVMTRALLFLLALVLSPLLPAGGSEPSHAFAAAHGETATDLTELSPEELMKVEVQTVYTASKFEQKVTEAPSSVSIVTADEIRKYGYRTLADILRSLRGFNITYDRTYSYVGVRGFGRSGDYNSRILLLVDGHRINDNLYDSAPLGTEFVLDVDLIERVEVVRGPGSSLYGNSAFFAVINVITRGGKGTGGIELSADTGSFDTYKGRLTYGDAFKSGVEALVSGTVYDSNGQNLFFPEFDDPSTNNGVAEHADYDRFQSGLGKVRYRDFSLEGLYSSRTKGDPTAAFDADFNRDGNKNRDSWWFVELKYERELREWAGVMGRLFYDSYDYHGTGVFDGIVNQDLGKGRWWGGELQGSFKLLDRNRIIAGVEYRDNYRQDQENHDEDPSVSYLSDSRSSRIWALYLQDEWALFKGLILNAGLRYDNYSTFGGTVNPRVSLIYQPVEGTVFKFLYGTAFRAPNVFELFSTVPAFKQQGNPSLGPEKIETYELIYEQYLGSHLRGTIDGYYYTINNLIVQVTDPADGFDVFTNLSSAEAKGVETELEGNWDGGWKGRLSYTFQDARDDDTGKTLVNSPRHLVKANLTVPLLREKVFLGIEEQFTDRRKTLAGNSAGSYFVTNLTLFSKELLKNLELSGSLYNLFDERYGDPGGAENRQDVIRQDGRTFRVKLTYRF